jgi:LL-diaminopimelate aminotransferase
MKFSVACLVAFVSSASGFAPLSNQRCVSSTRDTELYSGVERNENFAKLAGGYLFPEIGRRRNAYIAENPDMASKIISLGIGDTTQPIPPHILNGLMQGVSKLGKKETYTGG